jgi:hypothetical protein
VNKLLKRLLGLIFPGIDGEPDDVDPTPVDDPATPDPDIDDLVDPLDDDLPDDPPATARPRRTDADDRLAKLEAEVERRGRLAAEAERTRAPVVDPEFQREEERLRSQDLSDIERWQINANRTLRATQQQAQAALQQAQDMADRARFEAKVNSEPRRAKYTERVEEEIQRARQRGQQASREDVYYWMLGKDIAEGKLKAKPKAAVAANVPRGKTPGVRSDVQGRGRPQSDHDKRRARLENQNI